MHILDKGKNHTENLPVSLVPYPCLSIRKVSYLYQKEDSGRFYVGWPVKWQQHRFVNGSHIILSDVNLKELYDYHLQSGAVATLLASQRKTSRYLLFDTGKRLCGWINKDTGQVKPEGFQYDPSLYREYAFSGIHVLSPAIFQWMTSPRWEGKFSIMDFYLATCRQVNYGGYLKEKLHLIDIGKPETLAKATDFLYQNAK